MRTGGRGAGRWLGALLVAGSAASLFDVGPMRTLEEWLAPLVVPLDAPLAAALPRARPSEALAVLAGPAERAFRAWQADVLGSPAAGPAPDGRLLVPVLERRAERHELVVAVPSGGVRRGAAVAHRGVLLGFVSEVEPLAARATVALLGQRGARAVAAEWRAGPGERSVQLLLSAGGREQGFALQVESPSSSVAPPAGQLVWSRDVSSLGDPLPAGLYLGRLQAVDRERPGGGQRSGPPQLRVQPLLDPFEPDTVAIETAAGAELPLRIASARLLPTSGGERSARIDAGTRQGVRAGDWVAQDGLFVGRVASVAPTSAALDTRPPREPLLVMSPAGEVVACGAARASWPEGWEPAPGDLVATGHAGTGGLLVGTIAALDAQGWTLRRPPPDPRGPLVVAGAP